MELLAPAGDEAALHAAVCAGADAVYLGFASFGARAGAQNFDAEALARAVEYAHLHRVRVYVTVNTLVKQSEMEALTKVLATVAACKADAVIVQDMGVLRVARELFPALALHASTQMAIHTAAGVRFAASRGIRRAVLARECSLATVAQAARTGVEIEVFAHGALCSSVSGQCLLSSMAGGRSGNRGRCAQPCRQAVTLGHTGAALLSMKDLCLRDHLPALQQAGVTALKIEGRLKRPEYVAVVTESYRRALDALARGTFAPADEAEQNALLQIFHRGGFTKGHLMGAEDADLCAIARVGHGGVLIGRVLSAQGGRATVRLQAPLNDGDSLRVEAAADVELRYAGHSQSTQAVLRLRPGEAVRAGDAVYKTTDAMQMAAAQALAEPTIPLWLTARICIGEPLRLTATDGESAVQATGEIAQTPVQRALTAEDIVRQVSKLGDTPFALQAVPTVETDGAFAPVSALNALRRDAVGLLADARRNLFAAQASKPAKPQGTLQRETLPNWGWAQEARRPDAKHSTGICLWGGVAQTEPGLTALPSCAIRGINDAPFDKPGLAKPLAHADVGVHTLAVQFTEALLGKEFLEAGANLLLYAPRDWREPMLSEGLRALPPRVWLALPPQLSEADYAALWPHLQANAAGLDGVVLGSVGQLGWTFPLPVALGDGVPISNRAAAQELLGSRIAFCILWPELSKDDLAALAPSEFPSLLRVYGRERVMLLNHCPERVARGLAQGRAECARCAPEHPACARRNPALTDRRGYRFPLMRIRTSQGCVVEVYNALPTDLSRYEAQRRAFTAGMLLSFTDEPAEGQVAITARFAALLRTGRAEPAMVPATAGHFQRGVE